MDIFNAIIQGTLQGLTEFLPVSSSGHLTLSQHILGIKGNNLFFDVMLHIGTLIAVLAVYYKLVIRLIVAFFQILRAIVTRKFQWKKTDYDQRLVIMLIVGLLPLFFLFLPVPGTNMNIKDFVEQWSNSGNIFIVGCSLIATSILLTVGLRISKGKDSEKQLKKQYNIIDSICVGFMQLLAAILPGLSRSGSTLSVGLMRGIDKQTALDYSFVLGIPAILAAAAVELKDVMSLDSFSVDILPVIIGMVVSAVVGFISIKLFKWLLKTDKMYIFILYTLILGIATLIIDMIEKSKGINIFTNAIL